MKLTPEQQAAVSAWITAGDNISAVQKKLREQFTVSLTYMDTRFLVDDLNLSIKDPAPKANANDVTKPVAPSKPAAAQPGAPAQKKQPTAPEAAPGAPAEGAAPDDEAELVDEAIVDEDLVDDEAAPAGPSSISIEVDKVTLHPGALASGTVTFSDGVTGKWIVDNYGRPGFTEVSQPGYRPKPADAQAFMQELSAQLQKRGY